MQSAFLFFSLHWKSACLPVFAVFTCSLHWKSACQSLQCIHAVCISVASVFTGSLSACQSLQCIHAVCISFPSQSSAVCLVSPLSLHETCLSVCLVFARSLSYQSLYAVCLFVFSVLTLSLLVCRSSVHTQLTYLPF